MVAKVRPALVLSVASGDADRSLLTVVPHTTSLRGSSWEVMVECAFLKRGAFLVQGVSSYPPVRAVQRLGVLNRSQLEEVESALLGWLGYRAP
jgi:mRNA interferase MazF